MDLIQSYCDEDEQESKQVVKEFDPQEARNRLALSVINPNAASLKPKQSASSSSLEEGLNPTVEEMYTPNVGPQHPLLQQQQQNPTGIAAPFSVNDVVFDEQYHLEELQKRKSTSSAVVITASQRKREERERRAQRKGNKPKPGDPDYLGPWKVPEEIEEQMKEDAEKAEKEAEEAEEQRRKEEEEKEKKRKEHERAEKSKEGQAQEEEEAAAAAEPEKKKGKKDEDLKGGSSIFHLESERDYQGRSWIEPPSSWKPEELGDHDCFLPKRKIHTFTGHTKGVQSIQLSPKYGHLLLSAGLDCSIKVWKISHEAQDLCCARTYLGHCKPLRGINWSQDSHRFISCSHDKYIKLWDTETGKVILAVTDDKIPYCALLHPEHPDECIAGTSEKRVVQWDFRSGTRMQEYEQHQGSVNALCFVDKNRRFVSSSDDKSLRIWEYGIPVPIKYISESHMHSMPALTLHPSGEMFAAQSLDNQIVCYEAQDRFRLTKKRFAGHIVSGYACQMSFSPDGKYLISGDGDGRLWIWDWKSCKILKTLKCHDPVCIGCEWHPLEPSRVVTCGWDGKICYWD